jgi:hypothetical protein
MSDEEIKKAIKKWDLEDDFNCDTPKDKYNMYLVIACFENRKVSCTRIINDKKCERKIFKPGNSLDIHHQSIWKSYDDNLQHIKKKIKIIDFEIL